jgi:thiosulfate dehydrogenase [quinone] large subunit
MTTLTRPNVETTRVTVDEDLTKLVYEKIEMPKAGRRGSLEYIWALLRIGMGWIFLWAFVDKVFGLGYATEAGKGWIDGGSPTAGFLSFGTTGPLKEFYGGMAGSSVVEWMFMLGLLAIGLPLVLGIGVRIAASIGVVMLLMMYSALLVPEHNPVLDDHIIYAVIMLGLAIANPSYGLGLGRWWGKTRLAKRLPILE